MPVVLHMPVHGWSLALRFNAWGSLSVHGWSLALRVNAWGSSSVHGWSLALRVSAWGSLLVHGGCRSGQGNPIQQCSATHAGVCSLAWP